MSTEKLIEGEIHYVVLKFKIHLDSLLRVLQCKWPKLLRNQEKHVRHPHRQEQGNQRFQVLVLVYKAINGLEPSLLYIGESFP